MKDIDDLDEKILKQLLEDGRKSFVEIGEECKVPSDIIRKRYKEMKRKGIIIGATTQMNFKFFGYNAIASIIINAEPERITDVTSFLRKNPNMKEIYVAYKNYNITVIAILTNFRELDQVKDSIRKQAPIISLKSNLWLDIRNLPENLFLRQPTNAGDKHSRVNNQEKNDEKKEIIIDEMDIQLIEKLSKNGRCPFSKIAREVGTSTDTIIRRYERLKSNKIVKTVIQIDLKKIGYRAFALFFLSLKAQSSISEIVNELSRMPNVYHIVKTSGDYDLFVITCVKSFEHFFSMRDQIAKLPHTKIVDMEIGEVIPDYPGYCTQISTF